MRKIILNTLKVCIFLSLIILLRGKETYAEELKVNISTLDGEDILLKEGVMLYTAEPIVLRPTVGENDILSYSLSVDGGEKFGRYIKMEESEVTLYPDESTAPNGLWIIRFKCDAGETAGDAASEEESSIEEDISEAKEDIEEVQQDAGEAQKDIREAEIRVQFDYDAPTITVRNPEVLSGWISAPSQLLLDVTDNCGRISRVIAKRKEEIIYEGHYSPDDVAKVGTVAIPLDCEATDASGQQIEVYAYDYAGNSSVVAYVYYLDEEKPQIAILSPGNGSVLTEGASVKIAVKDNCRNAVSMNYYLRTDIGDEIVENSVMQPSENGVIEIPCSQDGAYSISAYAVDLAGNRSEEIGISFRIDSVAPVINIMGVSDGLDVRNAVNVSIGVAEMFYEDCSISVTVNRRRADELYSYPISTYSMASPNEVRTIVLKGDGDYDVFVKATDCAGRTSENHSGFRIDRTAPSIFLDGVSEGIVTNTLPKIQINTEELFYSSSIVSTKLLKKNSKGIPEIVKENNYVMKGIKDRTEIEIEEEGEYTLICTASDRSGNTVDSSISFYVDVTPPVIGKIDEYDGKIFKSLELPDFEKVISDITGVSYEAYLNDGRVDDGEVIIEEGKYELWVIARDKADNLTDKSVTFLVDHTSPQVVVEGIGKDGNVRRGSKVKISLVEEADRLEDVILDNKHVVIDAETSTAELEMDEYGDYQLEVVAYDEAGNETDKVINLSCVSAVNPVAEFEKIERTITSQITKPDNNDGYYGRVALGVLTVLTGTFGLTFRAFNNEEQT